MNYLNNADPCMMRKRYKCSGKLKIFTDFLHFSGQFLDIFNVNKYWVILLKELLEWFFVLLEALRLV